MNDRPEIGVLDDIQRRVLWLSTRIVDISVDATHADGDTRRGAAGSSERSQATGAGLVSVMSALWFAHLDPFDRVSVKPQALPVLHAIQYLLGTLDWSSLPSLPPGDGLRLCRPAATYPDGSDFPIGAARLGAGAPLFAAATRRYVDAHFGERPRSRFIALVGADELGDTGPWEVVSDPLAAGLGGVTWVVDVDRHSSQGSPPPANRVHQLRRQFDTAGWHVVELPYGQRLQAAFDAPGGELLRGWIDAMSNEQYCSLSGLPGPELRGRFLDGAPSGLASVVTEYSDEELASLVVNLGGHDLGVLLDALADCDTEKDRPSVVFAHTVSGWGLPARSPGRAAGNALLNRMQIDSLRASVGLDEASEWDRFDPNAAAGRWVAARREHLLRPPPRPVLAVTVPESSGLRVSVTRPATTQDAFTRVLVELARDDELAPYLVTAAPAEATAAFLAGLADRVGVFAPTHQRGWRADPVHKWAEGPDGQHIELHGNESSLLLLLGQLGLSWNHSGQALLAVGTVSDPLLARGLEALAHDAAAGARFLLAGTSAGVTAANDGHSSTLMPSVGLELPGVTCCEPAYAVALDWMVCDALRRMASGPSVPSTAPPHDGPAYYFRLTGRSVNQAPFEAARSRLGEAVLRRQVLAGAYRLVDASQLAADGAPVVYLVASGAVMPEVVAAARELADEGVAAHVIDVTSVDRLYAAWQRTLRHGVRTATAPSVSGSLRTVFPYRAPIVTVHDAASHAMAWLGSAVGVPCVPLGADAFGPGLSMSELYELHDLLPGSIVNAALAALSLA